jgi:hypothetical protein
VTGAEFAEQQGRLDLHVGYARAPTRCGRSGGSPGLPYGTPVPVIGDRPDRVVLLVI